MKIAFDKLLLLVLLFLLIVGFLFQQKSGVQTPVKENGTTAITMVVSAPTTTITTSKPQIANNMSTDNITKNITEADKEISPSEQQTITEQLATNEWIPITVRVKNYDLLNVVINSLADNEFKLTDRSEFEFSPTFSGNVTRGGLEKLKNNIYVEKIHYEYPVGLHLQESVPLIGANRVRLEQTNGLNITGQLSDRNITVCVIDTGINYTHPDLGGCTQTNNINTAGCSKVIGGHDYDQLPFGDDDPMDTNGHGTHVAGIVAANGNINGVALDTKLVALRATTVTNIKNAINWCINNRVIYNISIITISQGKTYINGTEIIYTSSCDGEDDMVDAANSAKQYGIFVDVSSGNAGSRSGVTSPACGSNVTSVGAIYDANIGFASFSGTCTDPDTVADMIVCLTNRNSNLNLLAPGSEINSTNITTNAGNYGLKSGTSMAAPHVAGLAALMKQANNSLLPSDIQRIMNYTGKPIYDPATQLTFRRIDAFRSVLAVLYNVFVSDLQIIGSNAGNRVFQFKAFNDLAVPLNVSWNISYGDGKFDNSTNNATLGGYQEAFVFVSHDYARPGNYTITAYANSSDSSNTLSMTIEVRPIEVNALKLLNQSSLKNIYGFNIKAPESDLNVSWVFYPKDGVAINSTQNISLTANQTIFVYFEYNYSSTGTYNVTANATDADKRYFDFNNINANVI